MSSQESSWVSGNDRSTLDGDYIPSAESRGSQSTMAGKINLRV